MKQRLMRPTAALFPIVGIAGTIWGNANLVMEIFVSYYLMQIFSLCAADCFRNAAAQEPGMRRVDSRFSGSFLPLIAGVALTYLLWQLKLSNVWQSQAWQSACIAAALIYVEHLFEERVYIVGRRVDGVILSCLANGLLAAGLLMGRSGLAQSLDSSVYAVIGAGLGAAVAIAVTYAIDPPHGFSLKPANLRFVTSAVPQTLFYIAAVLATTLLMKSRILDMLMPMLFGLIPWRLARTTCRRAEDESRPLNLLLMAFTAIPIAAITWLPIAQPFALTAYIALVCAAIIFCAMSKRLYAGIALAAAAFLSPHILRIILALASIAINIKQAFLKKV